MSNCSSAFCGECSSRWLDSASIRAFAASSSASVCTFSKCARCSAFYSDIDRIGCPPPATPDRAYARGPSGGDGFPGGVASSSLLLRIFLKYLLLLHSLTHTLSLKSSFLPNSLTSSNTGLQKTLRLFG